MKIIENYKCIQECLREHKAASRSYITNLYEDAHTVTTWIKSKIFYIETIENTSFFYKKNKKFYTLYYIANSCAALQKSLAAIGKSAAYHTLICNIVSKSKTSSEQIKFQNTGFLNYSQFTRMSRIHRNDIKLLAPSKDIVFASLRDCDKLHEMLHLYFDEFCEKLPSRMEIRDWIFDKRVLLYTKNGANLSFLIYSLKGYTLILNYWFVHPDDREKKIGTSLFKTFLQKGVTSKRQILWVKTSNENALKRYRHYGFEEDGTYTTVMIKNKYYET